ncbi:segregation/condensation protein A [Baaleninema sp.]|uniref:segregation/condensation protein A n=1 Tax=Baaleninema sp. TaxID=3101197 RepID=UPI003D08050A
MLLEACSPLTVSIAQDAIELLLDLAERGEIDPWDVRVVDVIDRHLSQLAPTGVSNGRSPYEADLSRSGQAFLYASMLLLLKADTLVRASELLEEEGAEDPEEADWLEMGDSEQLSLPLRLENQLRRRAVAPPPRTRPVTLQEMIDRVQSIAKELEDNPIPQRSRRRLQSSKRQAAREISQLAHQENLTETAAEIEKFLLQNWEEISQGREWVAFDRLLDCWTPNSDAGGDFAHHQVAVFWALLLLSSQSKVELSQDIFYQDLKIRAIADPTA